MQGLPSPPTGFAVKKAKILSQLAVPDATYTDLSPKGSVDEGIRHLIAEINAVQGLVTTSSCAGRVSVFVEGRKTAVCDEGGDAQLAGVGGKGGGGNWLLVSHDPVEENDAWIQGLDLADEANVSAGSAGRRLIHFKFEPMVSLFAYIIFRTAETHPTLRRSYTFSRPRLVMHSLSWGVPFKLVSGNPAPST